MSTNKKEESPADAIYDEVDDNMKVQLKDFFDQKVDGGKKSVWSMSVETFGMVDGSETKNDILTPKFDQAMMAIQTMVKVAKKGKEEMWKLDVVPMDQFNATMDDVLRSFIMWSRKEGDGNGNFNVSKAFRRLESYVSWVESHRDDLKEPFNVEEIKKVADAWKCNFTYDSKDRAVWWFDMGQMDLVAIKKNLSSRDQLRYVFYLCQFLMFDRKAQENGMVIVQSMGEKGMIDTFTMIPMDLSSQMDRLTIGVLPIRMKLCYTYNHLRWVSIMMTIFKPFMSSKMRSRIVVIPRKDDPAKVIGDDLGKDCIPVGFGDLKGKSKRDLFYDFLDKKKLDAEEEEGLEC
mmetsp:Transcript_20937/g.23910  ORF Transcript_20937/g.23910 Transcript_20937/m.23910 type:complete len:346 (-) Transcript_20937:107-1144(-)|eukprot:CAMPEP_0194149142 /NCGR_PEP_ID=MMETSP0152-20130528/36463_1 /TAXON_ID=1049557 /ORGANISM="Thalassiothrix antarctica, Strain L6-D1" /LENGTH=345 /DNA_ID=CAMNT_0038851127 /DNA_START=103 /DNA_END=1140 /DNA_ORIENTATION=-